MPGVPTKTTSRKRRPPPEPFDLGMGGTTVQRARDQVLLKKGYTFDVAAANRACEFFELQLRHSQGEWAGQLFILQPWQRGIVRRLFGWKRPDGTRRYRKLYCEIPRKNGKSTFAAGLALLLTSADGEGGAKVYGAATDKNQAKLVYDEACNMVNASEALKKRCEVFTTAIMHRKSLSSYRAISSEGKNKDGLNIHGLVIDELHEWDRRSRKFWGKLHTAQGSRRQPLTAIFTTAGDDPTSLWAEERAYARKIDAGTVINDEYLAILYGAKETDDWKDPAVWKRANPNYGVSLNPEYLKSQFKEALDKPSAEADFKRYHLNLLIEKAASWMPMPRWDRCAGTFDLKELLGQRCWGGLDLSRRTDITAWVKIFKRELQYLVVPRFWIPLDGIEERSRRDGVDYGEWVEQGLVTATPGDVIDYSWIRSEIIADSRAYEIVDMGYDPYGATQLCIELKDQHQINCTEVIQRPKGMSEPTKEVLNLVLQERIVHGGNPVLRWMAKNARAVRDSNDNDRLVKDQSAGRIDGIVALIMALSRATLGKDETSVYESGGIRTT
jgi:phage terminase large subunit-like protein